MLTRPVGRGSSEPFYIVQRNNQRCRLYPSVGAVVDCMADGKWFDADIVEPRNISIEQSMPTITLSKSSTLTKSHIDAAKQPPALRRRAARQIDMAGKVKYTMLLIGRVAARNAKGRAVREMMKLVADAA